MIIRAFNPPEKNLPRAMAIGFFDGVHRGHQALLRMLRQVESTENLRASAFTFDRPPAGLFRDATSFLGLLQTKEERERILAQQGVSDLVEAVLEPEITDLEPEDFLNRLKAIYQIRRFIVGEDLTFGRAAKGNCELLKRWCRETDTRLSVVPPVLWEKEKISSTRIRKSVCNGDLTAANKMLGRPYSHQGTIEPGKHLGRQLGYPTINLPLAPELIKPRFGVYVSQVVWEDRVIPAVSNIGLRPTVEMAIPGQERPCSETFCLESQWIPPYGAEIRVEYLAFIRPEQSFDSLEDLKSQIQKDVDRARKIHDRFQAHPQEVNFLSAVV